MLKKVRTQPPGVVEALEEDHHGLPVEGLVQHDVVLEKTKLPSSGMMLGAVDASSEEDDFFDDDDFSDEEEVEEESWEDEDEEGGEKYSPASNPSLVVAVPERSEKIPLSHAVVHKMIASQKRGSSGDLSHIISAMSLEDVADTTTNHPAGLNAVGLNIAHQEITSTTSTTSTTSSQHSKEKVDMHVAVVKSFPFEAANGHNSDRDAAGGLVITSQELLVKPIFVLILLGTMAQLSALYLYTFHNDLDSSTRSTGPAPADEIIAFHRENTLNWIIEFLNVLQLIILGSLWHKISNNYTCMPDVAPSSSCAAADRASSIRYLWSSWTVVLKILMLLFAFKVSWEFIVPAMRDNGHCFEYQCYSKYPENTTTVTEYDGQTSGTFITLPGECPFCTNRKPFYCPEEAAIGTWCHVKQSEEHPFSCGPRLCHIYDDCRVGGGADKAFLGFPMDSDICHNTFRHQMLISAVWRLLWTMPAIWISDSFSNGMPKKDWWYYQRIIAVLVTMRVFWDLSRLLILDQVVLPGMFFPAL